MVIWFTGQPGSGKTTLAHAIEPDFVVDGDDLREVMPNPGYDESGRRRNIDRAQAIAGYMSRAGLVVAVALIAPYRDQREQFKQRHNVLEVFLHTDEVRGREHFFADDYEPPEHDYLDIDTGAMNVTEAARLVRREMAAFSSRPRMAGSSET